MKSLHSLLGCALVLVGLASSSPVVAGGYVVVVNRANPVTSMTRSDLKRVATGGTKQWESGAVVQLGIIPGEAAETQYLGSLVGLSARELLARIQEGVFKGELRRPQVLRASAECIAFARAAPGALCVIAEGEPVPAEVHAVAIH